MFIEIQLSNGTLDTGKYERYFESRDWKEKFPKFPRIIVVGNRDFKIHSPNKLNFIQLDSSYTEFMSIFK
jgi:hypothetical protein